MCYVTQPQFASLTTGATATLSIPLPFAVGMEEALTQLEISARETLDTTTTEVMFYAEAFLIRGGNAERVLIDRGVVVGGFGQRNMVGMVGRIGYADGDYVQIALHNFSPVTVSYNIACAYETWPTAPDAYSGNCQGFNSLSKHVRVFWQNRRVTTQANAAGGKVVIDLSVGTGQAAILRALFANNSGTNGLATSVVDEDNAYGPQFGSIGSGAATYVSLPTIGTTASTTGNNATSEGFTLVNGQKLVVAQSGAGAQNDTLTIYLMMELLGNYAGLTFDKSRSTNAGDVTIGANTISDANLYHVVVSD